MPLLKVEAEKLSNNMLEAGVIEEIIDRDDLFAIFPFMRVNGKAYVYNREKTISEAPFVDPNETITEGAATFDEVTTTLKIIAGDVDVDKFLQTTMGDTNNQKAIQILEKAKGLARQFKKTLITGNSSSNTKQFDGLEKLCVAEQVLTAGDGTNSTSLTLTLLDELLDKIPLGADCLIMRGEHIRAFRTLMRAAGGNTAVDLMLEEFGRPMLTHNGVPILRNDFIPEYEVGSEDSKVKCANIYAARFNEVNGVHGIYGGDNAGIVVEEIGTVQNKDATRTRVKWYVGTALKATHALAMMKNVAI